MEGELFEEVRLNNDALNALLDIRFSTETTGGDFSADKYAPARLRVLEREGVIEHQGAGRWTLTEKGRTCAIRNSDLVRHP